MDSDESADEPAPAGQALVDDLAAQIRTRILNGDLPSGARLGQKALAEGFRVSRTPVREALRQLQASGLVEIKPHRGAVVRGPSARDIREAYFVRAELEGVAAELAAESITDEQVEQLREAADLFRRAVEEFARQDASSRPSATEAQWPRANDQFHEVILAAAGNDRLRETIEHLHHSFPRNLTWSALSGNSRLLRANAQEHDQILAAIEQRQPAAARKVMRRHVSRSGELVAQRHERSQATNAA